MGAADRFVVFQTAFPGDVILTLPLVQALRSHYPYAHIAFVAIPAAASIAGNHPAVNECIEYDKRGSRRGVRGALSIVSRLRSGRFEVALIPHRSIRSALICRAAGIPRRIGFSRSPGRALYTDVLPYQRGSHEVVRNLSLLSPLGISTEDRELPTITPGANDREVVDGVIRSAVQSGGAFNPERLVAIAPGSVWATKRWPREHFIALGRDLLREGFSLALVGGEDDVETCTEIASALRGGCVLNGAGKLSFMQSAELLRRCKVLVSNDSAPMHLAVAVRTPVVAIFGATVPAFGFSPLGLHDQIVETVGLSCRPCSIHGGHACPIRTYVCMKQISPNTVLEKVRTILTPTAVEK